jgi:hypothetical protein
MMGVVGVPVERILGECWMHTRFESISHGAYYNGFLYI